MGTAILRRAAVVTIAGALTLALAARPALAADLPARAAGWRATGKAESFDAKTIWQAINGAAELYIAYGFRTMRQREYRRGKVRAVLQVYDQGAAINAFGIFARERPPNAKALAKVSAAAAMVGKLQCLAYHGALYLKAQAIAGELDGPRCGALLAAAARALGGKGGPAPELGWLPTSGRVAGSLGYTRESYLGLRELSSCLHATYREAKRTYQLFVVVSADGAAAAAGWQRLARRFKPVAHAKLKMLHHKVPYRGALVVARSADGKRIYGVVGLGLAAAKRRLVSLSALQIRD